jgi:crotonobetainyl-CoA:carnitine CoA-transferase CaiB-like acyl-CoA transferase
MGQYIDLALLDVQLACLANQAMNYLVSGKPPERLGNAHPNIVPYQVFATADGYLILAVGNYRQFARFCELVGRPELASDERFARNAARVQYRETLIPILQPILTQRRTQVWLTELEAAGIPCGPINTLDKVFADPQIQHREMHVTLPHPLAGAVPMVASPLRFSTTPVQYRRPPPTLSQHTDEVLSDWLGLNAADINVLRADGII